MRVFLLDIPIDAITRDAAKTKILAYLSEEKAHLVTTPNPEMAVAASQDRAFLAALQQADLAIPDGFGLRLGAWLSGRRVPETITGVDFMLDIAEIAAKEGSGIYLLGGENGVAAEAGRHLQKRFPGLVISGASSDDKVIIDNRGRVGIAQATMEKIRQAAPRILFVAFGHGKQERWIVDNIRELPSVRVAMGVGGAFDFLAGRIRRAPIFMRKLGLEWFWRLVLEPRRLPRIWNAVVVFLLLIIRRKIHTLKP
ncbi:WecB/TagA/CpsF family glycosyltransferase [Candidatus Uhrbacteria bacterium]|nr:WecB/TagA/CpsF family glycosyltransferase [Candidatus Uhrbacteria bacterium]